MRPSAFIQSVLTDLPVKVFGSVPAKVPDSFALHTIVSNVPVSNGGGLDSMDCSVTVSVVAPSNEKAWGTANKVTELLQDAYDEGSLVAGTGLAFFEVTSHPVRQPQVAAVTDSTSYQYNAVYRMIFAV